MNLNYFLEFLKIIFLMWTTKKKIKIKKKTSQRHIGEFDELDGEGGILKKNKITRVQIKPKNLQGENRK